jgi:ethanolamine-phosphate cytidylyltransferase
VNPILKVLNDLKCNFGVHGDDMPLNADGTTIYDEIKAENRLKIIKRTEGVSTTGLLGRILEILDEKVHNS